MQTIIGNSSQITDSSAQHLLTLARLRSVSLTSFDNITDEGLIQLIVGHKCLNEVRVKECPSVSDATLNACIFATRCDPSRQLKIHFCDNRPTKMKKTQLPNNLQVVFEENTRLASEKNYIYLIRIIPRNQKWDPNRSTKIIERFLCLELIITCLSAVQYSWHHFFSDAIINYILINTLNKLLLLNCKRTLILSDKRQSKIEGVLRYKSYLNLAFSRKAKRILFPSE